MRPKLIAAIDPGASGAIAWIDEAGEVQTCSHDKRQIFIEVLHMTHNIAEAEGRVIYMEKVAGYYPKPKIAKPGEKEEFNLQSSAFSMFNFGKSAGICLGICEAFGIEPIQVMPAQWQKCCFVKKSGTRTQWKNALKKIAQRRYPQVKVTLTNADALLILSYGTLVSRGEIDIAPDGKRTA
jgi:hypothetical protein